MSKFDRRNQMIVFKQKQFDDNLDSVMMAMDKLDKPVSSKEIEQYLKQGAIARATEEFQRKYFDGQIDGQRKNSYIKKHGKGISLRTIQRGLKTLSEKGFVGNVGKQHNKYILSITGKREAQFRAYSQAYGTISLNQIMDYMFPTNNSLDKNMLELVKVFGVYVVYALIEATSLIVANKKGQEEHWHSSFFGASSNFREGKFRESRLVNNWIKGIFNPWYMLNMFLTAISNSSSDGKGISRNIKGLKTLMEQRLREDLLSRIDGVSTESLLIEETETPPSTLDLIVRRVSELDNKWSDKSIKRNKYLQFYKIRSTLSDDSNLLYELDSETIAKLKDGLNKEFPIYSKCLQKIDKLFYSK